MGVLEGLNIPTVEGLVIRDKADGLELDGSIAVQNPSDLMGDFFRSLHQKAQDAQLAEVVVDMRSLRFVNSSAIRVFVDWAGWVLRMPEAKRYKIRCIVDRKIAWQRTSLPVLKTMAKDAVVLDGL